MAEDTGSDEGVVAVTRPADFSELREILMRRRATLPRRLAQVADYAMSAPDEIAFGTASSVAERAGVQASTLVRFGQAFGYTGFSDLQEAFRERLRDRAPSYADRLRALRALDGAVPHASVLLEGFTDAAIRSLGLLRERAEPERLDEAVSLLARADTIYLVGQRRSYPATASMSYLFGKLGIRHVLIGSAAGTEAEAISFARPTDAAIVVSFTPYTPLTVLLAERLVQAGVPSIVVTDSPFSPVSPGQGIRIEVAETDFQGFRSLASTLTLLMSLALAVAETRGEPPTL